MLHSRSARVSQGPASSLVFKIVLSKLDYWLAQRSSAKQNEAGSG